MPAKKTVSAPDAAAPAPKRKAAPRVKKTEAAEAAVPTAAAEALAPAKRTRKTPPKPAAAATHKAPARKPAVRKPAPAGAFDIEAHRAEIEREAYFLWLNRGGAHGYAHEDWLRAIEIVKARTA
jgi:hypothetical protein